MPIDTVTFASFSGTFLGRPLTPAEEEAQQDADRIELMRETLAALNVELQGAHLRGPDVVKDVRAAIKQHTAAIKAAEVEHQHLVSAARGGKA